MRSEKLGMEEHEGSVRLRPRKKDAPRTRGQSLANDASGNLDKNIWCFAPIKFITRLSRYPCQGS